VLLGPGAGFTQVHTSVEVWSMLALGRTNVKVYSSRYFRIRGGTAARRDRRVRPGPAVSGTRSPGRRSRGEALGQSDADVVVIVVLGASDDGAAEVEPAVGAVRREEDGDRPSHGDRRVAERPEAGVGLVAQAQ